MIRPECLNVSGLVDKQVGDRYHVPRNLTMVADFRARRGRFGTVEGRTWRTKADHTATWPGLSSGTVVGKILCRR